MTPHQSCPELIVSPFPSGFFFHSENVSQYNVLGLVWLAVVNAAVEVVVSKLLLPLMQQDKKVHYKGKIEEVA
jgi:hypothetical protein